MSRQIKANSLETLLYDSCIKGGKPIFIGMTQWLLSAKFTASGISKLCHSLCEHILSSTVNITMFPQCKCVQLYDMIWYDDILWRMEKSNSIKVCVHALVGAVKRLAALLVPWLLKTFYKIKAFTTPEAYAPANFLTALLFACTRTDTCAHTQPYKHTSSSSVYPAHLWGFYNTEVTQTFHLKWTANRFWDKSNVVGAPQHSSPAQQPQQRQSGISLTTAATFPPYLSSPPPRCSLTEIIEVGRWWEVNEALPTHNWPFPSPCANHRSTVFWTFLNESL